MISILPVMNSYSQNQIKSDKLVYPSIALKADTFEKTAPSFKGREQYKLLINLVEELRQLLSKETGDIVNSTELIQKAEAFQIFNKKCQNLFGAARNSCSDSIMDDSFLARRLIHDVNNKLCVPEGYVSLIKNKNPKMTFERYDKMIRGVFSSTSDIMDDYLSFIDGDSRTISQIVELAEERLKSEALAKKITIKLPDYMERIGKYSKMTLIDKDGKSLRGTDLYNTVLNLVQNAVKYSPEGSTVTVKLEEKTIKGQRHVALSVEDQGIGFSRKGRKGVLKGKRAQNAIDSGIQGTGFGLKEIKRTLDLIGAKIGITTPLDKTNKEHPGSRFTCLFRVQEN